MRLYHFTSIHHLPRIMQDGFIKTTESNGDMRPGHDHAKPDVVWLLDTPSADAPHGLDGARGFDPDTGQILAVDKRAVRITVDVPKSRVERWDAWCRRHGVDQSTISVLTQTGGGEAATRHWWVTERRIDKRFWTAVDVTGPDGVRTGWEY